MGANTTVGSILINEVLPENLKDHSRVYDKKTMISVLNSIGEKHPEKYGITVKQLKDLGDEFATQKGSSFSFDDIKPVDVRHVHKKYEPLYNKARKITDEVKKDEAYRSINTAVEKDINSIVDGHMKNTTNRFMHWGAIGARGKSPEYRQMLYASGNQVDVSNKLYPHMAKNCFSRGLTPSDYFISALGARKGIVGSFISVRDPGAFAKELYMLTNDMVTTEIDCGTVEGLTYSIDSPDALDRCLLKPAGNYHRNDIVTSRMQQELKMKGIKTLETRSPQHCNAKEGYCQKCVGLLENGKLSPIGDAVGLRSAQALTERLTQMALGAKHSGGVVGQRSPFETVKQLMHVPESFAGGAILAKEHGTVDKIEITPAGDKKIHINNVEHLVSPTQGLYIKKGDKVSKGDALSEGLVNPAELVSLKGITAGRDYMAKILRKTYAENGADGHPKVFEAVARAVINLGEVHDAGDHDYDVGEKVRWSSHVDNTKKKVYRANPHDAVGFRLHKPFGKLPEGTMITPDTLQHLKGLKDIEVYKKPAIIKPMMLGTERAALHKGDWLSDFGFRFIKNQLKENVSLSKSSDLHSYNPIPAYVYGVDFGKGEKGRY